MLALANMLNLFMHELTRLRARRLPFPRIFAGFFNGFSLGHFVLSDHYARTAAALNSPTISSLKEGISSGLRLVTRPPSLTTD